MGIRIYRNVSWKGNSFRIWCLPFPPNKRTAGLIWRPQGSARPRRSQSYYAIPIRGSSDSLGKTSSGTRILWELKDPPLGALTANLEECCLAPVSVFGEATGRVTWAFCFLRAISGRKGLARANLLLFTVVTRKHGRQRSSLPNLLLKHEGPSEPPQKAQKMPLWNHCDFHYSNFLRFL